jgi:hypothetical protein
VPACGQGRGCVPGRPQTQTFTERDGTKGPPPGNKTRLNRTYTTQSKATQRKAKPRTQNSHTGHTKQASTTSVKGWARPHIRVRPAARIATYAPDRRKRNIRCNKQSQWRCHSTSIRSARIGENRGRGSGEDAASAGPARGRVVAHGHVTATPGPEPLHCTRHEPQWQVRAVHGHGRRKCAHAAGARHPQVLRRELFLESPHKVRVNCL